MEHNIAYKARLIEYFICKAHSEAKFCRDILISGAVFTVRGNVSDTSVEQIYRLCVTELIGSTVPDKKRMKMLGPD